MRFAVVGDPVDHSRSPAIHTAGFRALGIDATFEALRVSPDDFELVVADLRNGRLDGVSVTMPHKDNAYAAVDTHDALAIRSVAVNTIVTSDGELRGYNTDVAGVVHAVELLGLSQDAPVVVLGYGGAARAALVALGGRSLYVAGRDTEQALSLISSTDPTATVVAWGTPADDAIVVNATPLGMHGEGLPMGVLESGIGLVDMTYGTEPTPAVAAMRDLGKPSADGLDMLVGQAVQAFELFTGISAPVDMLERAARES